jgi:uncharacterized protein (DUF2147 family)
MQWVKAALIGAGLLDLAAGQSQAQTAGDPVGVWRHPDNGSHSRIAKCGGGLCATIIKVRDPSRTDIKNPDPKLRKRPVEGITIMKGGRKAGENTWSGKLYNTQDGETYSGTLTLVDKDHLKLQGCVLGGLICQGPTWTRIK